MFCSIPFYNQYVRIITRDTMSEADSNQSIFVYVMADNDGSDNWFVIESSPIAVCQTSAFYKL